jgi:GxxExxY protein
MDPERIAASTRTPHPALIHEALTREIIGAFYAVYRELGPGLLESLYGRALEIELAERGLPAEREHLIEAFYHGQSIGRQRIDLLVNRTVIVEIKSTDKLPTGARRQLRCYLKTLRLDVGLLLHFGAQPAFYRELGGRWST